MTLTLVIKVVQPERKTRPIKEAIGIWKITFSSKLNYEDKLIIR